VTDAPAHPARRPGLARRLSQKLARRVPFRPRLLRLDAPTIAFTFDDFPISAALEAAPMLEAAGMRGTFYLASGLMGCDGPGGVVADAAMVSHLAARGHEIGAHTHAHLNASEAPVAELLDDVGRNDSAIAGILGEVRPSSFAYPYGGVSVASKLALMHRYAGLRGISQGVNRGLIDLAHLKTIELFEQSWTDRSAERLLDGLERRPGWLIFYTHDVRPAPSSFGCTPGILESVVDAVRRRGFRVETVGQTLSRIGAVHDRRN
jgi:peptidoglycan/xylan/chitin deacetylase (PgdA/CDA1 family)